MTYQTHLIASGLVNVTYLTLVAGVNETTADDEIQFNNTADEQVR
jgi:hypothetical protein